MDMMAQQQRGQQQPITHTTYDPSPTALPRIILSLTTFVSRSPIVTGASVLAIKYAGGVMMMADTLGSPQPSPHPLSHTSLSA
jgi:hypothetical protein